MRRSSTRHRTRTAATTPTSSRRGHVPPSTRRSPTSSRRRAARAPTRTSCTSARPTRSARSRGRSTTACASPPRRARTTSCWPPRTWRRGRRRSSAARRSARDPTATRSGAGLVEGVIDLIVSDHSPAPASLKLGRERGLRRGVGRHRVAAARPADRVDRGAAARHPTRAGRRVDVHGARAPVGLSTKGAIAECRAADLAVFAPDALFTVVARRWSTGIRSRLTTAVNSRGSCAPPTGRRAGRPCGAARAAAAAGRIGEWGRR
jgi:hypothetical protein